IATFAAWLAGILITHQGKAADFQAHSAKFISSLSIVYLGREVIKKQMEISNSDLILALQILLQMVINTQLEHGIYD
ncbi:hypothetical protein, partial [Legionella waltersii]